jgi:hypothetical protein
MTAVPWFGLTESRGTPGAKRKKVLLERSKRGFFNEFKDRDSTYIRLIGLHYSANGFYYLSTIGRQK